MVKTLLKENTSHADRGAIVSFSHIDDLRCEMESLKSGRPLMGRLDAGTNVQVQS
jgi:hypothetical protein